MNLEEQINELGRKIQKDRAMFTLDNIKDYLNVEISDDGLSIKMRDTSTITLVEMIFLSRILVNELEIKEKNVTKK